MIDLNYIYQDFCGDIMNLNENYFYDRFYLNTIPYSNIYKFDNWPWRIPSPTATVKSLRKVLSVSVKYNESQYPDFQQNFAYKSGDRILSGGYTYVAKQDFTSSSSFVSSDRQQVFLDYIPVRETSFQWQNIDAYNNEMLSIFGDSFDLPSGISPVYIFSQDREDSSNILQWALYIYPYTKQQIARGLKVDWIQTIIDLTDTMVENQIQIEREYHNVLVEGWMWLIYQSQGKLAEATAQQQRYMFMKAQALSQITDRTQSPSYIETPNLILLQ